MYSLCFFLYTLYYGVFGALSGFVIILLEEESAGYFALVVFITCHITVCIPHCTMGWSAVCVCGILKHINPSIYMWILSASFYLPLLNGKCNNSHASSTGL